MKIKKLGHCCLLIQTKGLIILTDPGVFSSDQNILTNIDVVLITHEHPDHLHIDSLKEVLKNNPNVQVITNSGVGLKLKEVNIPFTLLEGLATTMIKEVMVEAMDCKHEEIYKEMGQVQNTGYFIDNKFFYPGDAFSDPKKKVEILALPVAGSWCRMADALNYAIKLKPDKIIPVHDGLVKDEAMMFFRRVPSAVLKDNGIEFIDMNKEDEKEF